MLHFTNCDFKKKQTNKQKKSAVCTEVQTVYSYLTYLYLLLQFQSSDDGNVKFLKSINNKFMKQELVCYLTVEVT